MPLPLLIGWTSPKPGYAPLAQTIRLWIVAAIAEVPGMSARPAITLPTVRAAASTLLSVFLAILKSFPLNYAGIGVNYTCKGPLENRWPSLHVLITAPGPRDGDDPPGNQQALYQCIEIIFWSAGRSKMSVLRTLECPRIWRASP